MYNSIQFQSYSICFVFQGRTLVFQGLVALQQIKMNDMIQCTMTYMSFVRSGHKRLHDVVKHHFTHSKEITWILQNWEESRKEEFLATALSLDFTIDV